MSTHKRLRLSIRAFQWPAGESVARLRKRCFHITQQGCEAHRWSVTVFSPEFLDPLGGGVSDGGCTAKCDFWVLPLSFAATPTPSASSKSPQRTSSPCLHLQEHIFVVFLYFCVCAKGATEARVTQAQCEDDSGKSPASQSPLFFWPKPSFRCVESWPALPRLCGFSDLIQSGEAALPNHPVFVGIQISNSDWSPAYKLTWWPEVPSALSNSVLPRAGWLPAVCNSQVLCVSRTSALPTLKI